MTKITDYIGDQTFLTKYCLLSEITETTTSSDKFFKRTKQKLKISNKTKKNNKIQEYFNYVENNYA